MTRQDPGDELSVYIEQTLSIPPTDAHASGVVHHCVCGNSQPKQVIHLYVWQENDNRKDSNLVASACNHCLRDHLLGLCDVGLLRLFSDSCFSQNENMNMMVMLFALRKQCFPSLNITYVFTVRGHSFLPADRMLGRVEQKLRKMDMVLLPSNYHEVLKDHGTVHMYYRTGGRVIIVLRLPRTQKFNVRAISVMFESLRSMVMLYV